MFLTWTVLAMLADVGDARCWLNCEVCCSELVIRVTEIVDLVGIVLLGNGRIFEAFMTELLERRAETRSRPQLPFSRHGTRGRSAKRGCSEGEGRAMSSSLGCGAETMAAVQACKQWLHTHTPKACDLGCCGDFLYFFNLERLVYSLFATSHRCKYEIQSVVRTQILGNMWCYGHSIINSWKDSTSCFSLLPSPCSLTRSCLHHVRAKHSFMHLAWPSLQTCGQPHPP